jgi:hypothetical protein
MKALPISMDLTFASPDELRLVYEDPVYSSTSKTGQTARTPHLTPITPTNQSSGNTRRWLANAFNSAKTHRKPFTGHSSRNPRASGHKVPTWGIFGTIRSRNEYSGGVVEDNTLLEQPRTLSPKKENVGTGGKDLE